MVDGTYPEQPSLDINIRLRDLEERNSLLRDRVLLLGQSLIEERDKSFKEIQEMKANSMILKEDVTRLKELMKRMTEQIIQMARKEELMTLQRQLDMLRKGS